MSIFGHGRFYIIKYKSFFIVYFSRSVSNCGPLIHFFQWQGSEWVLAKKSEKRVMPSSMADACGLLREFRRMWFLVEGFGSNPPENVYIQGLQILHSNPFSDHFTPIQIPSSPLPKKILFRVILISRMVLGV